MRSFQDLPRVQVVEGLFLCDVKHEETTVGASVVGCRHTAVPLLPWKTQTTPLGSRMSTVVSNASFINPLLVEACVADLLLWNSKASRRKSSVTHHNYQVHHSYYPWMVFANHHKLTRASDDDHVKYVNLNKQTRKDATLV